MPYVREIAKVSTGEERLGKRENGEYEFDAKFGSLARIMPFIKSWLNQKQARFVSPAEKKGATANCFYSRLYNCRQDDTSQFAHI
jgi:hypothetical protein